MDVSGKSGEFQFVGRHAAKQGSMDGEPARSFVYFRDFFLAGVVADTQKRMVSATALAVIALA